MRQTETDPESVAEHTIADCWNIDAATTLSDDGVRRTWLQVIRQRSPDGYKWVNDLQDVIQFCQKYVHPSKQK